MCLFTSLTLFFSQICAAFEKNLLSYAETAKIKTLLSNKPHTPELQLASRACLIFLEKTMIQKKGGGSKEDNNNTAKHENKLDKMSEQLLQLEHEQNFKHFASFFHLAQSFNSPLTGLDELKIGLAKTLAPIYPYLENV